MYRMPSRAFLTQTGSCHLVDQYGTDVLTPTKIVASVSFTTLYQLNCQYSLAHCFQSTSTSTPIVLVSLYHFDNTLTVNQDYHLIYLSFTTIRGYGRYLRDTSESKISLSCENTDLSQRIIECLLNSGHSDDIQKSFRQSREWYSPE